MMTITINAQRGTRVSTPRPRAITCALVPSMSTFAYGDVQVDGWAGVRVDGHTATGPSAWSPPI